MSTWSVNSYSYPNPFQASAQSQGSWEMFSSFVDRSSYAGVKDFWAQNTARRVQPHSVESWKATFEEFGLLYVLTGTDKIVITPGGRQLLAAVDAQDETEFAWVGLNLLLRYPLRGKGGRRSRGEDFEQSDLLLYWFVHGALLELDGFWQQELFRVLAHVFRRSEVPAAIERVQRIRAGSEDIAQLSDPSMGKAGGVYNALNQVMVHGSLNHMIFTSSKQDSPYFPDTRENWWHLRDEYRELVELALGGPSASMPAGCAQQASLAQRIPIAPEFADEREYFDYVGAAVTSLGDARQRAHTSAVPAVDYGGEAVFLLSTPLHFVRVDTQHVVGPIQALCTLDVKRRVLVSDDLDHTYIVEAKHLIGSEVQVTLRRARPIIDQEYVRRLFGEVTS